MGQGAGILIPLADMPWGERYGKLVDPFGHAWSISRRIEVPIAGTAKRKAEGFSVHEPRADQSEATLAQIVAGAGQGKAA
jgi:hypothetical protein